MAANQQDNTSSSNTLPENAVTDLPASALKYLEPSPGGQWMAKEHQGALHVAYNVVGNTGVYHYLINPCTTEEQVFEHCDSFVYKFPGIQENHEELERFQYPDRFDLRPNTRSTPTMTIFQKPRVLALNGVAQTVGNNSNQGVQDSHITENKEPATSLTTHLQEQPNLAEMLYPQTEAVSEDVSGELLGITAAQTSTSWPAETSTQTPAVETTEAAMFDNDAWVGDWVASAGSENVIADLGWTMPSYTE